MKKLSRVFLLLTVIAFASCSKSDDIQKPKKSEDTNFEIADDAAVEGRLANQSLCAANTLVNPNPFTRSYDAISEFTNGVGCSFPSTPVADCFATQLRRKAIVEFGAQNNNFQCGLKGNNCPTGSWGGITRDQTIDLASIGVSPSGGFSIQEANTIYQELLCRLIYVDATFADANYPAYLRVDDITFEWRNGSFVLDYNVQLLLFNL